MGREDDNGRHWLDAAPLTAARCLLRQRGTGGRQSALGGVQRQLDDGEDDEEHREQPDERRSPDRKGDNHGRTARNVMKGQGRGAGGGGRGQRWEAEQR